MDVNAIQAALKDGVQGRIIEVDDEEDDERVEIFVESSKLDTRNWKLEARYWKLVVLGGQVSSRNGFLIYDRWAFDLACKARIFI